MKIRTRGDRIFDAFNELLMALLCLTIILPFYFVFTGTLVSQKEYLSSNGFVFWPKEVTFDAYKVYFEDTFGLIRAYGVSIARVLIGTSMNVLFTSMLAYVLSKKWLPGRMALLTFVFITMNFSGGLIPTYALMRSLHLIDTFWAMIVPGLIGSYNMIILRNFFQQVPVELEESAYLDGAGELTILFRVIFPLSLPSIATIALFYAVGHWNAWFDASIYLTNTKLYPLTLILRKIIIQEDFTAANPDRSIMAGMLRKPSSYALKNTAILYTSLPIICVYPFLQKYFVKGVLTGSIKG